MCIYKLRDSVVNIAQSLKQAINLPGLGVDVHIQIARCGGQSGDRLDVGSQGIAG